MAKKQEFLSAVFKIHSPTARKREVLEYVFNEYTLAMQGLLDYSYSNLDTFREKGKYVTLDKETGEVVSEKYTDKSIAGLLPKSSEVSADMASTLKEALVSNVSAMVASYLALCESESQEPSWPVSRDPSPSAYPNAIQDLITAGLDLDQENLSRDKMLTLAKGSYMPIHFSRSRDFALLTNKDRDRFYIYLKLLPSKHPLAVNLEISDLVTVGKFDKFEAGEVINRRGGIGLLLPIELGQRAGSWHWQYRKFIEPCLAGRATIKASKLVKKDEDYFLHVSIGFDRPLVYKPLSFLGIDRGVFHSMAYSIVDLDGNILKMEAQDDGFRDLRVQAGKHVQERQRKGYTVNARDYKRCELDGIVHRLVNKILDDAEEHQSQIVFEDLNLLTVGRFYKSAYKRMAEIVIYKAKLRGVPVYGRGARGVWAAYTSQICISCGERNKDRKRGKPFDCDNCGAHYHSDSGAGVNIARRAMYKAKDWGGGDKKTGDYWAFHRSFANAQDFSAKIDLRNVMTNS